MSGQLAVTNYQKQQEFLQNVKVTPLIGSMGSESILDPLMIGILGLLGIVGLIATINPVFRLGKKLAQEKIGMHLIVVCLLSIGNYFLTV